MKIKLDYVRRINGSADCWVDYTALTPLGRRIGCVRVGPMQDPFALANKDAESEYTYLRLVRAVGEEREV